MALAGGHSKVKVGPLTEHTRTSIHFSELLTGVRTFCIFPISPKKLSSHLTLAQAKFNVTEAEKSRPDENCFWIECAGVGFNNSLLD